MRLESLRIKNFRGIRSLELTLGGKSAAFLGPNGTGKSSIVDAVDFLLRGGVRRLEGEGAGELSLARHAPFIGSVASDAWVEGTFTLTDGSQHTFRRAVADPDQVIPAALPSAIDRALSLARDGGHHLLTRRELLRFVFTEPSSRAKAVGLLLQLDGIEVSRKNLQGAARDAADELRRVEAQVQVLATQVGRVFEPALAADETPLARANELRGFLGGAPLEGGTLADATRDLATPSEAAVHPLHSPRTQAVLRGLGTDTLARLRTDGLAELRQFCEDLDVFSADQEVQDLLREASLVDLGISLLDEDMCPLCRHPQPATDLRAALAVRQSASQRARAQRSALESRRDSLFSSFSAHVQRTMDVLSALSSRTDLPYTGIAALGSELTDTLGRALRPIEKWQGATTDALVPLEAALSAADGDLESLRSMLRGLAAPSRIQSAWDQLVHVSRATAELSLEGARLRTTRCLAEMLARADSAFLAARDQVLQDTYDAVADAMADVYKQIHGDDESQFRATMEPTRAGLKLAVEFRGKGRFPPAAFHSEGHQDSMGLAFFLALSSHLAGSGLPLILLDDVVMSVDYSHRRGVADMLASRFGDRQILITTHDRVWWRQLRSARVVGGKQSLEIMGWTLQDGILLTRTAADSLGAARDALSRGNAVEAAVSLRRAIEECFPEYCDALAASVRFRADGANEAGEFLQAAVSRLKELTAKARASKRAWRQDDFAVKQFDDHRAAVCQSFEAEAWLVNRTLHYNSWTANMSAADFAPILAAYEALLGLFECESCGSPLFVTFEDRAPVSLRCPCGAHSWNLAMPGPD